MPFSCIPLFVCNRQIDSLDRRQCNLQTIPVDIDRNARTLEEIYLDCNHIKDLDKPLFRCRKLKTLSASENEIIRLPSEIAYLAFLEELNLKSNDISDLPEELKECSRLRILDLSSNPITRLPATITLLISMTHLGLNDISLTQMPQDIGLLKNLRSLEVRENLLRSIPSSISQLTLLQRLDLGHNELDDLPNEIGLLMHLEELYVDQNDLESLPESIIHCRALEQLDVSENKLMVLPDGIGDLENLNDLTVAQNCLQVLPSSIGRLKKLAILKADRNAITQLTPAIGNCLALNEIFFMENLLTELPSSIGNLKALRTLNMDKNQLKELPPTIGGCTALTILSFRDNLLGSLPLEIGRLENLRVLDICNNRLNYLPFTISVLFKLQALWLSENQSQAFLKLQTEHDPRSGIKVLTCYLLPQNLCSQTERAPANRAFIGGPKVHFGSDLEVTKDEEGESPVGQFARHDTPHPKPHSHTPKFKKQSIDGHIIHHEDDHATKPPSITLSSGRKRSVAEDSINRNVMTPTEINGSTPRSALKQSSFPVEQVSLAKLKETNVPIERSDVLTTPTDVETLKIEIHRDANGGLGLSIAGGVESTPFKDDDSGLFVSKLVDRGPAQRAGLKVGDKILRVNNTDVVNVRHQVAVATMQEANDAIELTIMRDLQPCSIASTSKMTSSQNLDASFMSETLSLVSSGKETISTTLCHDAVGYPGFSVASRKGVSDCETVVISAITPGGAAGRDGKLLVGDRVLSINGTNMRGARHDQAIAMLTGHTAKDLYLVVQRDCNSICASSPSPGASLSISQRASPAPVCESSSPNQLDTSSSSWDGKKEDVELYRDGTSLGLSIVGGSDHCSHPFGVNAPGVFISKITPDSPAARCQRLRIGDRILSVNNIDIRVAKHKAAVEALKNSDSKVLLTVIHEPQLPGLKEVIVKRAVGEPFGVNICGGVGKPPSNPLDKTDEGIFIDKVESGSVAAAATLVPGLRILEVNDESILGYTQEKAAKVLRKSGTVIRLLVCDAFSSTFPNSSLTAKSFQSLSPDQCDQLANSEIGPRSASSSEAESATHFNASVNGVLSGAISQQSSHVSAPVPFSPISSAEGGPIAASSPLPDLCNTISTTCETTLPVLSLLPALSQKCFPPPTAPKPRINHNGSSSFGPVDRICNELGHGDNRQPSPLSNNPEQLQFSSKLRKFEREIEIKSPSGIPYSKSTPPAKKPLVSEDDVKKLREDESKRVGSFTGNLSFSPTDDDLSSSFEHILNNSAVPPRSISCAVRTKKAENRVIAASTPPAASYEPLNAVEQRALEHQKRQEWRQARYKSLEVDSVAAEKVMQQVQQINNRLANINEESISSELTSPIPANEKVIQNEISYEQNEFSDPVTGETRISCVERSITQREVETSPVLNSLSVSFADNSTGNAESGSVGLMTVCTTIWDIPISSSIFSRQRLYKYSKLRLKSAETSESFNSLQGIYEVANQEELDSMRRILCATFQCSGGVEAIDRRQCNLKEVPNEIDRNVNTLEELYLDCNQIKLLTNNLFRCLNLRVLSIGQNRIETLPPSIGLLKSLEHLNIDDNELSELPLEIEECQRLQVLDVRMNPLARFPYAIMKLVSLTHLNLFETSLRNLPDEIDLLKNLLFLDVRENQLCELPASIGSLNKLKLLDIGQNEISSLPSQLGMLEKLEEFYADNNLLTALPESFINCRALHSLDLSYNNISSLPDKIGDLQNLIDLNISNNCIDILPDSIGELTKLTILKSEMNNLTNLPVTIGNCSSLVELYLTHNTIENLPSTVGGLVNLKVLYLNRNNLHDIPSTIGSLTELSIFGLRSNRISELPLEIGRLTNLCVLDICDNCLPFLPFTLSVLCNLRAVWISVNQVAPLVQLEAAQDPVTKVKILTCYLLPQGKCREVLLRQRQKLSLGGNVNFKLDDKTSVEGERGKSIALLQRRGTPHPRSRNRAINLRRHSLDGRLIRHFDDRNDDNLLCVSSKDDARRKSVGDRPSIGTQIGDFKQRGNLELLNELSKQPLFLAKQRELDSVKEEAALSKAQFTFQIERDSSMGFGLSISRAHRTTMNERGEFGLYVSYLKQNGPSARAGVNVGDEIVSVNGISVLNADHRLAAELMREYDTVELSVKRVSAVESVDSLIESPILQRIKVTTTEVVLATIRKGRNGTFGLVLNLNLNSVDGENNFAVIITSVDKENFVCTEGTVVSGDRILSINGTSIATTSLELAKSLLSGKDIDELSLILERSPLPHQSKQSPNSSEYKICEKSSTSGIDSDGNECLNMLNIANNTPVAPTSAEKIHRPSVPLKPKRVANFSLSGIHENIHSVSDQVLNSTDLLKPQHRVLSFNSIYDNTQMTEVPNYRAAFRHISARCKSSGIDLNDQNHIIKHIQNTDLHHISQHSSRTDRSEHHVTDVKV